jgi:hypothetical protein
VTYTLSYTPSHDQWDGGFREIKVKLKRPNVELSYRKGYYARPEQPAAPDARRSLLAAAALTPLAATGVTLVARLTVPPTRESPRAVLSVVVDAHDITVGRDPEGLPAATLDVVVHTFGAGPAPLRENAWTVREPVQPERIAKEGLPISLVVEAPPEARRLRVVVRDASTGRVGSVDVPVRSLRPAP